MRIIMKNSCPKDRRRALAQLTCQADIYLFKTSHQGRHLRGAGGPSPSPPRKKKKEKRKKGKKEKQKKKRKKEGNYE